MADDACVAKPKPPKDAIQLNPATKDNNNNIVNADDDLISGLPDDILCRIIALLPPESAFKTSLLSTRWKHIWKSALLTLAPDAATTETTATETASVVEERRGNLVSDFINYSEGNNPLLWNKWGFQFDMGQGGRVLLFAISPNGGVRVDFSSSSSSSGSGDGGEVGLFDWSLELRYPETARPYSFFCWAFELTSLYISSVNCLSDAELASMVSTKLPHLKRLTIAKCKGLKSLSISEICSEIEQLVIMNCPQLERICFLGFKLTSFVYRGKPVSLQLQARPLGQLEFDSGDPSNLIDERKQFDLNDVMVYMRQLDCPISTSFSPGLNFLSLRNRNFQVVKSLTLCRWIYNEFMDDSYTRRKWRRFCLHWLEELWWIDNSSRMKRNVNPLLFFLKHCPNLRRLYVTIDDGSCFGQSGQIRPPAEMNELEKLELVKLQGFRNEYWECHFIMKLKPVFKGRMPVIVANTERRQGTPWRRLVNLDIEVQVLEGIEGNCSSLFQVVDNVHDIGPDHIHMKLCSPP